MRLRRHDLGTAGLDDFLANLGGHNTGLRVPAASIGAVSGLPLDYLFLLDVLDLAPGIAIVGVAQLLTIAAPQVVGDGASPVYPGEVAIRSILWRFPDSFMRWIVTVEGMPGKPAPLGPSDSDSFVFQDSSTPALVYQTVHFPAAPPAPGYLGLDDYTAPGIQGSPFLEVRDLRYPWRDVNTFRSARWVWNSTVRVRFYLKLRQTSPATRSKIPLGQTLFTDFPGTFAPEDGYLSASQNSTGELADTLQYWRCAGRLLLEDTLGGPNA